MKRALILAAALAGLAVPAAAQGPFAPARSATGANALPAGEKPNVLREVGFDQNLGATLPLDATFRDETGRTVRLGDYFGKRPVVLSLAYYECPMLCTLTLNSLASALSAVSLDPGQDFEVVTISFEPRETYQLAAAKKAAYLKRYKRDGAAAGWHFLTGDQASIDAVTRAVGFRYTWDKTTNQWAHASGIVVVTPDGRLSHYLYGIEYAPKDLRLALVEASSGKVGSPVDKLVLFCYHYDPTTGRYGVVVMSIVRIFGLLTLAAIFGFIAVMRIRDRAAARRATTDRVN